MSSPPFQLMSSWTHVFLNKVSLFSHPIKKEILTDGDLLIFTWLSYFKMCLNRVYISTFIKFFLYSGMKVSIKLNTACIHYGRGTRHGINTKWWESVSLVFCVGFGSQHRQVHKLTTTARARLASPIARATRVHEWWVQLYLPCRIRRRKIYICQFLAPCF